MACSCIAIQRGVISVILAYTVISVTVSISGFTIISCVCMFISVLELKRKRGRRKEADPDYDESDDSEEEMQIRGELNFTSRIARVKCNAKVTEIDLLARNHISPYITSSSYITCFMCGHTLLHS